MFLKALPWGNKDKTKVKVKLNATPFARQFGSKFSFLVDRRGATPSGERLVPRGVTRCVSEDISATQIADLDLSVVRALLLTCLLVTRPSFACICISLSFGSTGIRPPSTLRILPPVVALMNSFKPTCCRRSFHLRLLLRPRTADHPSNHWPPTPCLSTGHWHH